MISVMDELEKMTPSAEEEEEIESEEGESEEEGGEDDGEDDGKDEEDEDGEEQEGKNDEEKEEEATPQAADKSEKNNQSPVKPKEKKQPEGLNLNNEVVRMRKEVKRVRALIIRKLTRQIGALKKKKGKETEIERNQRRAARLLEEIHAMKVLSPDLVTKTALQKTLNFDQECKNPKSTISSRAIARIGTHPQFNKKIEAIKAAVKAFKEERMKGGKLEKKEKVQNKAGKTPQSLQSPDKKRERESEKEEADVTVEEREIIDNEEGDGIIEDAADPTVAESEKETEKATPSVASQRKEIPESKNATPASHIKSSEVKDIVKNRPQSKAAEKKPELKSAPEVLQKKKDEEESDLELSDDEEKEYFDDSTEERFHKQSSQSEESDDDDFFVGKVSKFKKKKQQKSVEGEKAHEVKADPTDELQSKLDELESRLKSKTSLQSVFCSSLSASKPGGGRGASRGRGGDNFRGQERQRGGPNRDFSKQSKFQKQEKGAERNSGSNFSKSESSETGFPSLGRGRGRGRGDFMRQKDRRGGGVFSHQAPEQALHPSWEASKKRKEQQGQIMAFQGKKIKFDDDD